MKLAMKTAAPTTARRRPARRQGGIALLEAMLAILILGIGLIGTVGLQARAYSALSDASLRAEATLAGEKLLGTMNADSNNLLNYGAVAGGAATAATQPWVDETRAAIPGALIGVVVTPQQLRVQVDITIVWQRKAGAALNQHLVTSYIAL